MKNMKSKNLYTEGIYTYVRDTHLARNIYIGLQYSNDLHVISGSYIGRFMLMHPSKGFTFHNFYLNSVYHMPAEVEKLILEQFILSRGKVMSSSITIDAVTYNYAINLIESNDMMSLVIVRKGVYDDRLLEFATQLSKGEIPSEIILLEKYFRLIGDTKMELTSLKGTTECEVAQDISVANGHKDIEKYPNSVLTHKLISGVEDSQTLSDDDSDYDVWGDDFPSDGDYD